MSAKQNLSYDQLKALNDQFAQQLKELDGNHSSVNSFAWKQTLLKIFMGLLGLILPFVLLVRTSVLLYSNYHINGWLALSLGVLAKVLLLVAYGGIFIYKFGMGKKAFMNIIQGVLVLAMAFALYGIMYHSSLNTESEKVHSYYRSLHPIMRVALSTVTLADSDMVITDIRRRPKDYQKMGLSENKQSLHYLQENGYVHAVDLRTKGRPVWKNWLFENVLKLLGLSTIRHVGTEDHIHVYLPLND